MVWWWGWWEGVRFDMMEGKEEKRRRRRGGGSLSLRSCNFIYSRVMCTYNFLVFSLVPIPFPLPFFLFLFPFPPSSFLSLSLSVFFVGRKKVVLRQPLCPLTNDVIFEKKRKENMKRGVFKNSLLAEDVAQEITWSSFLVMKGGNGRYDVGRGGCVTSAEFRRLSRLFFTCDVYTFACCSIPAFYM